MRRRKVRGTAEGRAPSAPRRARPSELLFMLALCLVGAWIAYAFAQETYVSQHLRQEEQQLRQQNARLAQQNEGYQGDIVAVMSGADAEESARHSGYARADEKVYLVGEPPPSAPPAKPTVHIDNSAPDPAGALRRWLTDHLHP